MVAEEHYFRPGEEPLFEMQRLTIDTAEDVEVAQRGDDDELIRLQRLRASEGKP